MKRKSADSPPARIYSYGAFHPTENRALVEEQLRLAHRYRNLLVEIEQRRRERWEALVESVLPSETVALHEERRAAVEGARAAVKRAKTGKGKRADVGGEKELLDVCVAQLREIDPVVKAGRARLRDAAALAKAARKAEQDPTGPDAPLAAAILSSDATAHGERIAARAASGLRHGNYVRVEGAVDQAVRTTKGGPPHFTRYDGTGAVGTQLLATSRSGGAMGLTVREALSGEDTRLRIVPLDHGARHAHGTPVLGALDGRSREERLARPPDGWMRDAPETERLSRWRARPESERLGSSGRHQRRKAARMGVQIRVGSNPDRSPIFATFPIVLHRPLPEDGVIKWAYVLRRRVGLEYQYRFQLTMEAESFRAPAQPAGRGTVAINLGWRNLPDGGIRVAYLVDDAGRCEEVRVPPRVMERRQKPDDLRSIRDRHFDVARAYLRAFLDGATVPDWLRERVRFLAQWRATRKLAGLLSTWRRQRFDGDAAIVAGMEAWAKKDRHLLAWESSQRDRTLGHRRMVYQRLAVDLARRYAAIVIADMDLRDFASAPAPEDGVPSDGKKQRTTARVAAPGELRSEIRKAQAKYGAALIERERAANLTQTCNACGACEPWDAAPSIMHRCVACGETWDQDANHCRNLLATWRNASGPVTPEDGEVLDDDNDAGSFTDSEATRARTTRNEGVLANGGARARHHEGRRWCPHNTCSIG